MGDAFRAWGRTSREGEFLTLDQAAAGERIGRGRARLAALGLDPIGFVPPAWLAREASHRAVGDAGLGFSEDERAIRLFPSGARVASPVVRWSARTPMRAWGSIAVARARWTLQAGARVARIALHPQDLEHRVTAAALGPTLDRWLVRHRPIAYSALQA
jgi:predicted deacetylase